jgi:Protein of unknown function (DUF4231)
MSSTESAEIPSKPTEVTDGTFDLYLAERYLPQVEWYVKKANANHRRYLLMQSAIIVGSTLVPVLTANFTEKWVWLPVSVSTAVAILIGLLSLLQYQEKWMRHRAYGERLKREHFYFTHQIDAYEDLPADQRRRRFVRRVEELIDEEQVAWIEANRKKLQAEAPPSP